VGNLIKKTNIFTGETWLYGYDNANQMTAAEHRAGNGTLLMHADYAYDVFGNRLAKSVRTGPFGAPVVTRFAYDDRSALWADLNVNNNLLTRYVGGDQTDQLFTRISSGGAVAWYLPDHLGSVRDLTDNTGTVQDHIDYDAFGNVIFESTPSFSDRYKYSGREFDSETGLQYNRARYYDPKTGRWMAKDPIGFRAGDANLYRYVGNDVTNATDPSGQYLVVEQGAQQSYQDWLSGLGISSSVVELPKRHWWRSARIGIVVPDSDFPKLQKRLDATESDWERQVYTALLTGANSNLEGDDNSSWTIRHTELSDSELHELQQLRASLLDGDKYHRNEEVESMTSGGGERRGARIAGRGGHCGGQFYWQPDLLIARPGPATN
jgi:RHS repeat-associated protein